MLTVFGEFDLRMFLHGGQNRPAAALSVFVHAGLCGDVKGCFRAAVTIVNISCSSVSHHRDPIIRISALRPKIDFYYALGRCASHPSVKSREVQNKIPELALSCSPAAKAESCENTYH